jgi:DNA-binding NarL/FixJ family response regulator
VAQICLGRGAHGGRHLAPDQAGRRSDQQPVGAEAPPRRRVRTQDSDLGPEFGAAVRPPAHREVPGRLCRPRTPREAEVLRLLARGLSDREIAEALFLSPRTVGEYVTKLLAKLDLGSRTAAAVYAVRRGLA